MSQEFPEAADTRILKVRLDASRKKRPTILLLREYLSGKAERMAEWYGGECGFWDVTLDVFLQRAVWIGYGGVLVLAFFGKPEFLAKTLAVGGIMLILQASILAGHFFFLVWQDLARERRNEPFDAPVSMAEILRREIDFERWCA